MAATGPAPRLQSLDALRGFDMFWIIGGSAVVAGWAELTGWPWLHWVANQCEHVEWHGFKFWDLIFPLFLFIAGVAMPFSLTRRVERGDGKLALHLHVVRRGLVLVLLGVVYNGLLRFDFEHLRYASVLGRIGLGYLFCGLIVLNTKPRGQVLWAVAILVGYWLALTRIPVPGFGAGVLEPGATLPDFIDRTFLPGRLHREVRDPEGLLSTVPAVATALIGALAGHWLRRPGNPAGRRVGLLFAAGLACLALGGLWHRSFPINKNLWTSSFVLWTAGWSLQLLALFHLVIDVWGLRRWAFFFVVIGMNPITIYMLQRFIDFDAIGEEAFAQAPAKARASLIAMGGLCLRWVLLLVLHKQRIYLRV
jgi:predicted acyltransferase